VEAFDEAAGVGKPKYGQLAMAVDDDEARARRVAHELFRFGTPGWKVMSELPNPVNFEAATANVREEDVAETVTCGADVDRHVEAITRWTRAGFDRIAIVPLGDLDRFFELWEQELHPRLQSATVGVA
jgi:hypothetical protein